MEPGQRFADLLYPFKKTVLGVTDFLHLFNLYFIYVLSDIYYFLPSLTLGFITAYTQGLFFFS